MTTFEFTPGQRVTRIMDGALGTVETVQRYEYMDEWKTAVAVRLDKDGEVWSGWGEAWADATVTASEYIITECPVHGVKVCSDAVSFQTYVSIARDDDYGWMWDASSETVSRLPHAQNWDTANACDPWRCCYHMVIDPMEMMP